MACLYSSQSKNWSRSWASVDFGCAASDRLLAVIVFGDRREVRQVRRRCRFRSRLPALRQGPGNPVGIQLRPGAVGDDGVQAGVQRIDQRLVVFGHRERYETARTKRVGGDGGVIAVPHHFGRLHCRRHPRVDLMVLQAGVQGGEVGEFHRLHMHGVDDVGLFDGALNDAYPLPRTQFVEAVERRAGRHDQRQVTEVVAVGKSDCAAACFGGDDRRRGDVEASRRHLGEQAGEFGAGEDDVQSQLRGDRAQQLVVITGVAPRGVQAAGRGTSRLGPDGQGPRRAQAQRVDVHRTQRLDIGSRVVAFLRRAGGDQLLRQGHRALFARRLAQVVGRRRRHRS